MRMLVINTCGGEGVVALADESGVIAAQPLPGRGTSEAMLPAVRRLFPAGFTGVDAIGVMVGPGSFTGVRVGLSTAKGLCEAAAIGMVAISRLAMLAAEAPGERVLAILDGSRGEFYCGVFDPGHAPDERLLPEPAARALMEGRVTITCEARVAERLAPHGQHVRLLPEPGAEAMRRMVLHRIAAGQWSDVATADAHYLRRTDAELMVAPK